MNTLTTPLNVSPIPIAKSKRLNRAEALDLLRTAPLAELGRMAHARKLERHGNRITFVRNRHINPTNLCVYSCKFCDFAAKKGDVHAYELTEKDILEWVQEPGLSEVHIVGGLWPTWGFTRSMQLIRRIKSARPDLWVKAFTAVEVAFFSQTERLPHGTVLQAMRDAGVDQMPGGGAEVLSERIHQELYKSKIGPDRWLEIHETAHTLGLPSNATMLFGHIETDEEIVEHLFKLRESQDRIPGFQSFIPLAYQPGKMALSGRVPSAPRCLKVIALARLVLDNFEHIKAYWPTLGIETAAAALSFGADDVEGTLGRERIMQAAGSEAPASLIKEDLFQLIEDAGQIAVERNGRFEPIMMCHDYHAVNG